MGEEIAAIPCLNPIYIQRYNYRRKIPVFPQGYTVEDVLRSAYRELHNIRSRMEKLEEEMSNGVTDEQLKEYDTLVSRFQSGGGYEMDVELQKVCNGLAISKEQRSQLFESLSGGEKTRMNLARLL